jgi:hypothetical protein
MSRLTKPTVRPAAPRRCRIADWTEEHACDRKYLRPVYGLGHRPDARKPDPRERRRAQQLDYLLRKRGPPRTPVVIPPAPYSIFTAHL